MQIPIIFQPSTTLNRLTGGRRFSDGLFSSRDYKMVEDWPYNRSITILLVFELLFLP